MIGIFDSGIGGVTVLKKLIDLLPNEEYLYYSDSKNSPYGDKSEEELKIIVSNVVTYLINRGCKIIVIACNTASTLSDYLREKFNILFVAIEPAYKLAHDFAYNKRILVMATKRTIESDKFKKLYDKYNNSNTILLSCSGLADLIEKDLQNEIDIYLKEKLGKYNDINCVVLGCTHYPLIKNNIEKVLGKVEFFDGSSGVSKRVFELLEKNNMLDDSNGDIEFFDSSFDKNKENKFFEILNN